MFPPLDSGISYQRYPVGGKLTFNFRKCTFVYIIIHEGDAEMEIGMKEARSRLSSLLKQVEAGDEVVVLRRGKKVARLVSFQENGRRLPSLKEFRSTIRIKGMPLSGVVLFGREEERY